MNELQKTAYKWLDWGIATIPISWKSKQPRVRWLPYTERLPEANEIDSWYASSLSNIGIVTGWQDLTIIDFDDMAVFYKWAKWADKAKGTARRVLSMSRMHLSARGVHIFVRCPGAENMKLPKIDVLAERKYALIPPSIHPSGAAYVTERDVIPMAVGSLYDVLPAKLLDAAKRTQEGPKAAKPAEGYKYSLDAQSIDFDPWTVAGTHYDAQVVDRIKERFHIEDFFPVGALADSGGGGRWKLTRCPFHDDHNPSFWIDTDAQLCGCHSGCTPLPLDVIDFYARLHHVDNETAILELAKRL